MFNNAAYPYAKERYEGWKKRHADKKNTESSYCPLHPMILPENDEKIRWVMGVTKNKDGTFEKFKYCPKCYLTIKI